MAGLLDFIGQGARGVNGLLGGVPGMAAQQANGLLGGIPGQLGGLGLHELQALGLLGQPQQAQQFQPQQAPSYGGIGNDFAGAQMPQPQQPNDAGPSDPSMVDEVHVQGRMPPPLPAQYMPPTIADAHPSILANIGGMLMHGRTWGEADLANRRVAVAPAQAQFDAQRMGQFYGNLQPAEQQKFIADPAGYLKNYSDQFAPQTLKKGEMRTGMVGQTLASAPDISTDANGNVVDATSGVIGHAPISIKTAPGETAQFLQAPDGGQSAPQGQPPALPPLKGFPASADIIRALPGTTITSAERSPAHNAAVGGVPRSYHLTGQAYDLVPPKGVSMGDYAAQVAQQFPTLKAINEGDHIHLQPQAPNGLPSSAQGKVPNRPHYDQATNKMVQDMPDGTVKVIGDAPFSPSELRKGVMDHEDYKQATAATTAVKAMIGNAGKMDGPSAYAVLDTYARAINPGAVTRPQVIQTIEHSLGPYNQIVGALQRGVGQGGLPANVRQQVLDAVLPFAKSHYQVAKALNDQNTQIAQRIGMDPRNVVAPLESIPGGVHMSLPSPNQLQEGHVYFNAKGTPAIWQNGGFHAYN
jgi:hypothetical protein